MSQLFQPVHGVAWFGAIAGALVFTALLIVGLQLIPQRFRRNVILAVTFLGGLYFVLEFFLPTHPMPTPEDPDATGNFLTPFLVPWGNISPVIQVWTIGMGVVNLCQVHGKRVMKGASGAFNSWAFFIAMITMLVLHILQKAHPNAINKNLDTLLFEGALQSLDATMFSIIAFYIVSAAYRAFRVRSVEATLLLVTAVVVMLGQIAIGMALTDWIPRDGIWHSFHVEVVRDWLLTKANTPANRAIAFGLGIGGLAVALRIWLGLERGSYFENQG